MFGLGSWDSTIKIWTMTNNLNGGVDNSTTTTSNRNNNNNNDSGGTNTTAAAATWQCVRTISDHTGAIRSLTVCNNKVVSCSDEGTIKVWTPGSWTCVRSMEGCHDGAVNALISCRGRLASAGDDGTIKLWGASTWSCEVKWKKDGRNTDIIM